MTAFADYFAGTTDLDSDGYIGIPVSLDVYTKDTAAETIDDCVKPDGTPIDLDLKMDIIYPSQPEKDVPVFMLAASSETRNNSTSNRPHHTGFLMRGYACMNYKR